MAYGEHIHYNFLIVNLIDDAVASYPYAVGSRPPFDGLAACRVRIGTKFLGLFEEVVLFIFANFSQIPNE
ncbi:MAG: hypothetical protein M3Y56_07450 [Armatimonadota bacterium]|nr:hypothetical protein [Armatimonadota bacterium]